MMIELKVRPRAYSYVRMSTPEQLKGDSRRRQLEAGIAYALEHDLELIEERTLEDIGVSAYAGANASTGKLAVFLEAVRGGTVPQGSYLLVESLDRLSREHVTKAFALFTELTAAGINLVTLADGHLYKANSQIELGDMIYSIVVMARANEESAMKSKRVSAAWSTKRKTAATKKLSAIAPNWLRLLDDRSTFEVVPGRGEVIQRIFQLAIDGLGADAIQKVLNREGVPVFGKRQRQSSGHPPRWGDSYVEKILKSRAVLGEFQPHRVLNGKRVPDGDPVADYYPAVVSEDLFYRVQSARRLRATGHGGRKGVGLANLFTHLARCGYCGAQMSMINKGEGKSGGRYLQCSTSRAGRGCCNSMWPYQNFESGFLLAVQEADLASVLGAADKARMNLELRDRASALAEQRAYIDVQIAGILDLVGKPGLPREQILARLAALESDRVACDAKIETCQSDQRAAKAPPCGNEHELRAQIESLRLLPAEKAFQVRSRIAARLREVVAELRLEVDGLAPLLAKTTGEQRTVSAGRRTRSTQQPSTRSFTVKFADGSRRSALVAKGEAAAAIYVSTAKDDLGRAGAFTVDWASLSGPASLGVEEKITQTLLAPVTPG